LDNPEGFKGVGESATIPVPAAIAAAVEDALRKRGVKVALTDIPLTPERVFNLIRGQRS
jgi:CO/xanthine dehydrogenase Mo-binding subunit